MANLFGWGIPTPTDPNQVNQQQQQMRNQAAGDNVGGAPQGAPATGTRPRYQPLPGMQTVGQGAMQGAAQGMQQGGMGGALAGAGVGALQSYLQRRKLQGAQRQVAQGMPPADLPQQQPAAPDVPASPRYQSLDPEFNQ